MLIHYDYLNKRARVDIDKGYEAAKTYIRRYDSKNEYMIRLPPINDCKRSYLGELMAYPDIPTAQYVGVREIRGIICNQYLIEEYDNRIHIFMSTDDEAPVQLIQESTVEEESVPMLTYDYSNVRLEEPDEANFDIINGFEHSSCDRHVGGFPYLHIFHHYIRF
jgi:hypothetical protein